MRTFPAARTARGTRPAALRLLSLLACATLLAPAGAAAQAQAPPADREALALLERAAERYRGIESFCASFRQTVVNDILRQTTRSRGELCQRRPDRFEMRFSDPEGDRVVADGTHLWAYFPSTDPGQAYRTDPGAAEGRFDLHREFLTDPGTRYRPTLEGTEPVEGRPARILLLEPTGSSLYVRARIWVDTQDALIRKIEITETEGFVRTVELEGLRLNVQVPADRFRFEPPPGVRVVGR